MDIFICAGIGIVFLLLIAPAWKHKHGGIISVLLFVAGFCFLIVSHARTLDAGAGKMRLDDGDLFDLEEKVLYVSLGAVALPGAGGYLIAIKKKGAKGSVSSWKAYRMAQKLPKIFMPVDLPGGRIYCDATKPEGSLMCKGALSRVVVIVNDTP